MSSEQRRITVEDVEENARLREEEAKRAREKAEKDSLRDAWIKSGGLAAAFEKEWTTIRREQIRRAALELEEQAKTAIARRVWSGF